MKILPVHKYKPIFELFDFLTMQAKYLDAFVGLVNVKKTGGENPEDCIYVQKAKKLFVEIELPKLIKLCEEIINEYK